MSDAARLSEDPPNLPDTLSIANALTGDCPAVLRPGLFHVCIKHTAPFRDPLAVLSGEFVWGTNANLTPASRDKSDAKEFSKRKVQTWEIH